MIGRGTFPFFLQIRCLVLVESGALVASYQYQLIIGSEKFDNHPKMSPTLLQDDIYVGIKYTPFSFD